MVTFREPLMAAVWAVSLLLAGVSRWTRFRRVLACGSMILMNGLALWILMEHGTLLEVLACMLPVVYLMLPREIYHEL